MGSPKNSSLHLDFERCSRTASSCSIHPWPPPILARTPFRRVIIENLPAASVRNDLISIGKSRPRPRSRRAELDPGPQRIGRKVAFRDPLLALYKSPSIDERRNDGRSSRYRARNRKQHGQESDWGLRCRARMRMRSRRHQPTESSMGRGRIGARAAALAAESSTGQGRAGARCRAHRH